MLYSCICGARSLSLIVCFHGVTVFCGVYGACVVSLVVCFHGVMVFCGVYGARFLSLVVCFHGVMVFMVHAFCYCAHLLLKLLYKLLQMLYTADDWTVKYSVTHLCDMWFDVRKVECCSDLRLRCV